MCFSNLPVEFDEDGNPRLADEAESVDKPACGCSGGSDVPLTETDPGRAYDEIVQSLPADVRERLDDGRERFDDGQASMEASEGSGGDSGRTRTD